MISGVSSGMINQINKSQQMMNLYSKQIASGTRLVNSSVDPSGMAIATKMVSQIRGFEAASKNVTMATGMLETADGALQSISDMMGNLREKVIQAGNGTYSTEQETAIKNEINNIVTEIKSIISETEYNGKKLLAGDGENLWIQTGPNGGQGLSVSITGKTEGLTELFDNFSLTDLNQTGIDTALGELDSISSSVSSTLSTIGSAMNRMEHTQKYIDTSQEALNSAHSRISDVNEAQTSIMYNNESLKQQASVLMLGNMMQQQGMLLNLLI